MHKEGHLDYSVEDFSSRIAKEFELAEKYTTRVALTSSTIAGAASVIYSPFIHDPATVTDAGEIGVAFGTSLTFAAVSGSVLIAVAGSNSVKRISERFALRAAGVRGFKTLESARRHRQELRDQLQSRP